ncbi:MAG: hypothetical protein Q9168_005322 [Polycauliona sp. 1 TL-2023]
MAFKMPASWDYLPAKTMQNIMAWFKSGRGTKASVDRVTKVVSNAHAITKAATLPPMQSLAAPTASTFTTNTMPRTTTAVTGQSSAIACDDAANVYSSSFDFLQAVDWSLLGYCLFFVLLFGLFTALGKLVYDNRHFLAHLPGYVFRLPNALRDFLGRRQAMAQPGNAIHVVGDMDFHIDENLTQRLSRAARRAMEAAARHATAGNLGRYVPVNARHGTVRTVRLIRHPIFHNVFIGVTVWWVTKNNGHLPLRALASSAGDVSLSLAFRTRDVLQDKVYIRPQWFDPFLHTLGAVFGFFKAHWLLTSFLSILGIYEAVVKLHNDYLGQERRNQLDRAVFNVRVWFATIDWRRHRVNLHWISTSCCSGSLRFLVMIGKVCKSCVPWLGKACSLGYECLAWAYAQLETFGNYVAEVILGLIDQWQSLELHKKQQELDHERASRTVSEETTKSKHSAQIQELNQKLDSKTGEIFKLQESNNLLGKDLEWEMHLRRKDLKTFGIQINEADTIAGSHDGTGWQVARTHSYTCISLREEATQHLADHAKVVQDLDEARKQLKTSQDQLATQQQQASAEHAEAVAKSRLSARSRNAKDDKINELKDAERDLQSRLDTEAAEHSKLKKLYEALKAQHDPCASAAETLKREKQKVDEELNTLKSNTGTTTTPDDAGLKKELDDTKKDLVDIKKNLSDIQDQHASCDSEKKQLQQDKQNLDNDLRSLRAGQSANSTNDAGLKKELDDTKKDLADTRKELQDSRKEHENSKKELEDSEKEHENTKKEFKATKKELDDLKASQGTNSTNTDESKAELEAAKQATIDVQARHQKIAALSGKHIQLLAQAAYKAQFPEPPNRTQAEVPDRTRTGLDALRLSLRDQFGYANLKTEDLQVFCNVPALKAEVDSLRTPAETDNSPHNTKQLALILARWTAQQKRPMTLGIREKIREQEGNYYRIEYDLNLGVSGNNTRTVWILRAVADMAKEGEAPNTKITYFGLCARPPPPAPKTAEEEYDARFSTTGFSILDSDTIASMSGLTAPIETMRAMQAHPSLQHTHLPIPTYDVLEAIAISPSNAETLRALGAYEGDFGHRNLSAAGINWVLQTWGQQQQPPLNLAIAVAKGVPDNKNCLENGYGLRTDVMQLGFAASSSGVVDGRICTLIWIYDDSNVDPEDPEHPEEKSQGVSEWHGMKPKE